MKKILIFSLFSFLIINLSGCVDQYGNTNYEGGATIGGAATGAFLGSRFGSGGGSIIGGAIGAVAGGFLGNQIGKRMDANAREAMNRNALYALNKGHVGQSYSWETENAGGSFLVTKDYRHNNSNNSSRNEYCREFTQKINIGGRIETGYGTACRQPNGDWKIVS
jgi:surface antigen